jgi:hypothetical protein
MMAEVAVLLAAVDSDEEEEEADVSALCAAGCGSICDSGSGSRLCVYVLSV